MRRRRPTKPSQLADAIAFPIDLGLHSAALDLEFGASVVVARFAKPIRVSNQSIDRP